jgi:hypothetical protein
MALLMVACSIPGGSLLAQRCVGCVSGEDTIPHLRVGPALGLHVGAPQKASAALGIVIGQTWQENGHDQSRNLALFAEPGLSGGRGTLAYVNHGSFGSGFGIGASVLRTWKEPWTVKPNMTYVGGEILVWPIVFVGPRLGVFRRVAGDATAKQWFLSLDLGIGL